MGHELGGRRAIAPTPAAERCERWRPALKMMPSMFGRNCAQGIGFVAEGHGLGRRQQRDFNPGDGQFVRRQRRKARIAEGGGEALACTSVKQRTPGFQAADAAAQFAVLGEGDEGRAGFVQCRQVVRRRIAACRSGRRWHCGRASAGLCRGQAWRASAKTECGIADHALPVARGVAGVAAMRAGAAPGHAGGRRAAGR